MTSDLTVRAVPYDERFLEASWRWLHDEEIRNLTLTPPFTRDQQIRWFSNLPDRKDYFVWGIEVDGKPAGAFGIKNVDGSSGEYWGYIGEKEYWGRGIGRWMLNEGLRRAMEMGIRRIWLRVSHENLRATKLYLSCGFVESSRDDSVKLMELLLGNGTVPTTVLA